MKTEKYNLLLPEINGFEWTFQELDKESALATISINLINNTDIAKKLIKNNMEAILNMNLSIKEIRTYLTGVSQAKFAKEFHLPLSTLSHWEQEQRTPPEYVNWMLKKIIIDNIIL